MPANFTEEQRKIIRERLIAIGYDLVREMGLKKMKVSMIAERADIATGTFYHFFESKEAYVKALIDEQEKGWQEQIFSILQTNGKLTLERRSPVFGNCFGPEIIF